jgi:maltooligosyltrehalose synthase
MNNMVGKAEKPQTGGWIKNEKPASKESVKLQKLTKILNKLNEALSQAQKYNPQDKRTIAKLQILTASYRTMVTKEKENENTIIVTAKNIDQAFEKIGSKIDLEHNPGNRRFFNEYKKAMESFLKTNQGSVILRLNNEAQLPNSTYPWTPQNN